MSYAKPPALPRMRSACQRAVLEVVVCEGRGVVGDLSRLVTYYYALDGTLLAKRDPADELEDA